MDGVALGALRGTGVRRPGLEVEGRQGWDSYDREIQTEI